MKNKRTHLILATVLLASPLMTMNSASAHEGPGATHGYVGDAGHHLVRDGFGNCLHTGYWSEDDATIHGCDGYMKQEPVAKAPPPAPAPKMEPVYEKVSINAGALFDTNKADIKPAGASELDRFAAGAKRMKVERINISGHTDSRGSVAHNDALSMRRAVSVKNYLLDKGMNPSIMSTVGLGESMPVADNGTAEGRSMNRRVDIVVQGARQVK